MQSDCRTQTLNSHAVMVHKSHSQYHRARKIMSDCAPNPQEKFLQSVLNQPLRDTNNMTCSPHTNRSISTEGNKTNTLVLSDGTEWYSV